MDMILEKSLTLLANPSVKVSKNEIERRREREALAGAKERKMK